MFKTFTSAYPTNMIVQFGNWIFHIRNFLFPFFYLALFIPSRDIFSNQVIADILGLFFIAAGILIRSITVGLAYVIRGGKNRQIYAEGLVTEGIYKLCRNPLYLGNIMLLFGFGIFANSLLFMLVLYPVFLFFYYAIIKAEEAFLLQKFGQQYENYRVSVSALWPNLQNLKQAFQGQSINWKKIIKKENNLLVIYFTGIILLLLSQGRISLITFLSIFALLLMLYGWVKYLKRTNKLN